MSKLTNKDTQFMEKGQRFVSELQNIGSDWDICGLVVDFKSNPISPMMYVFGVPQDFLMSGLAVSMLTFERTLPNKPIEKIDLKTFDCIKSMYATKGIVTDALQRNLDQSSEELKIYPEIYSKFIEAFSPEISINIVACKPETKPPITPHFVWGSNSLPETAFTAFRFAGEAIKNALSFCQV